MRKFTTLNSSVDAWIFLGNDDFWRFFCLFVCFCFFWGPSRNLSTSWKKKREIKHYPKMRPQTAHQSHEPAAKFHLCASQSFWSGERAVSALRLSDRTFRPRGPRSARSASQTTGSAGSGVSGVRGQRSDAVQAHGWWQASNSKED